MNIKIYCYNSIDATRMEWPSLIATGRFEPDPKSDPLRSVEGVTYALLLVKCTCSV